MSLGGQLVFIHTSSGDISADGYGAAPRVGYFAALGPKVGIWPVVSVGYLHSSVDAGDLGVRAGNSGTTPAANPFLLTNPQGTDFRRSQEDFKFDSVRVTAAFRF